MFWQKAGAFVIYAIFFSVMTVIILCKNNFHGDELLSYSLANDAGSYMLDFEEGYTYYPAKDIYLECMAANEQNGLFHFRNVCINQASDVHPPLYYLLLHTICSFFPGKFSIWHAAGINLLFALLTLYILRKLMRQFLEDEILVDICSFMFSLSVGVLQNVSFLRMYVMAMFWVTLTAWLFIRAFEERNAGRFVWERWLYIILAAVAGTMTHYYYLIFLFFTCVVFGIFSMIEKKWKDVIALLVCMAVSALDSICLFPAMLVQMFSGYRGVESINNLSGTSWSDYWERLTLFFSFIDSQMFGRWGGIAALVFFVLVFAAKKGRIQGKGWMKWGIAGIPALLYFLIVSKAAVYVTDRYLFPIYAVVIGSYFSGMVFVLRKILGRGRKLALAAGFFCLAFTIGGWQDAEWNYLFRPSAALLEQASEYQNLNCICIYEGLDDGGNWKAQNMFLEVSNYASITFINKKHMKDIALYKDLLKDEFMLTVISADDAGALQEFQEMHLDFNNYECIGGFAYSVTYHVFR